MDSGESLVERANALNIARKFDEAEKIYVQLLEQNHDNPGLLSTLGTLYLNTGKLGLAITLLQKAIEKKPESDYLANLAIAYKFAGQHPKAISIFERALKKNPSAETRNAYASMFVNVGEPEKLLKEVTKALEMQPDYPLAHWNMALALLEMGKWETAWDEHEWGFEAGVRLDRKLGGKPRWNGEPGTVAVYGEQGLGDEIMFASMIPDLMKTNDVILECHSRLLTLFQKSFPGVRCFGTREQSEIAWPEIEPFDYQLSIGSLGRFFRKSLDAFPGTPYLKAEGEKGGRFKIGISWTGGQKQGRVQVRSIPLPWWKSILNNDCEFVSLQYTDSNSDLNLMDDLGYSIKRNGAVFAEDYYETAKLVQSCDLVISCCTSVIHLAGALGVPCWVMVPNKPAWRYGIKGPMPWYRSVRLYRQPPGDRDAWLPVVEKVGYDLSELIAGRRKEAA